MNLDAESLRCLHPNLPPAVATFLALNVSIALNRHHKAESVTMQADVFGVVGPVSISWGPQSAGAARMLDGKRVTELGAEAIAFVFVH